MISGYLALYRGRVNQPTTNAI